MHWKFRLNVVLWRMIIHNEWASTMHREQVNGISTWAIAICCTLKNNTDYPIYLHQHQSMSFIHPHTFGTSDFLCRTIITWPMNARLKKLHPVSLQSYGSICTASVIVYTFALLKTCNNICIQLHHCRTVMYGWRWIHSSSSHWCMFIKHLYSTALLRQNDVFIVTRPASSTWLINCHNHACMQMDCFVRMRYATF